MAFFVPYRHFPILKRDILSFIDVKNAGKPFATRLPSTVIRQTITISLSS
jgi:hypothetical protein